MFKRLPILPLFLAVTAIVFVLAVALRAKMYVASTGKSGSVNESVALDPNARELHPELTGTLPSLPDTNAPAGSSSRASSPAAGPMSAATRAQRLRELLAQPLAASVPGAMQKAGGPPLPAPHPTAAPPKTAPPLPPRAAPMNAPLANSTTKPPTTAPHTGSPGDDTPKRTPGDPTSDTTPPQLLTAVFNPPQVHDGDDAVIYITATDDISGVRSISGTITSPSSKALQGFSCQPDPSGVPGSYVGHMLIPKDAEEGVWRVNFISLSDNASNTANLHINSGGIPPTAVLQVISNAPDNTPPTLQRAWLDRTQMKGADKNIVYLEASDDKSGVKFASGVFLSPGKSARVSFGCTKGDSDTQWTCPFTTPAVIDCGSWQLEQVQLQDGANNMATIRSDNPIVGQVKLTILADSCDSTPPVLQSLSVDPRVVSNQGGTVMLTATVTDDLSGVYGVMAQCVGPGQGSGAWFPLNSTGAGTNVWSGAFNVPKSAGKGQWRVSFVQVIDKANNLKLYTQNDPALANATFNVQ